MYLRDKYKLLQEQNENKTDDNTPSFVKHVEETKTEQSGFIKALTLMIVIFLGVLLGIFLFADNRDFLENQFGKESFITNLFNNLTQHNFNKEHADFTFPFGLKRQNILLLGVDSNGEGTDLWNGTRTDTIILLNIDPHSKSVKALSIPRDSKVYLPKSNEAQKINAAHAVGGIKMTIKTIENTLGVRIDKYIMVHDEAVRKIVETMGGIDIYVEKNMHYNDNSGHLHINLTKGEHHLNADEVVGYLRFRHDAMGDIGRTQRQQWFLRGLLQEMQKPQTIAKLPEIISVANEYVKTNLSLYEMSQYAALAKHFDIDNIEIATLPGSPNKKGYISYWILDPEKTQEVVNRFIYRISPKELADANMNISILYSKEYQYDAQKFMESLKDSTIKVKCADTTNATHGQFIAHNKNITVEYYNWIKKKYPQLESKQFVYDPINLYCSDTDFTVILAK